MAKKFKQYVVNMIIIVRNVSVETHHSIDMIERYHESLRRIYTIIIKKNFEIEFDLILQMFFKIFNDFVKSNGLILIFLIFEIYFKMIDSNASSQTIIQRVVIMRKVMNEIKKNIAFRQINDALNIRNESFIDSIHALSLNLSVLIFRESNANQSKT